MDRVKGMLRRCREACDLLCGSWATEDEGEGGGLQGYPGKILMPSTYRDGAAGKFKFYFSSRLPNAKKTDHADIYSCTVDITSTSDGHHLFYAELLTDG